MVSITAGVALLRWPLTSAVLMFIASTLKIQLRKSDYAGLAVISGMLQRGCWVLRWSISAPS
mgnify:CR=1 FL=1